FVRVSSGTLVPMTEGSGQAPCPLLMFVHSSARHAAGPDGASPDARDGVPIAGSPGRARAPAIRPATAPIVDVRAIWLLRSGWRPRSRSRAVSYPPYSVGEPRDRLLAAKVVYGQFSCHPIPRYGEDLASGEDSGSTAPRTGGPRLDTLPSASASSGTRSDRSSDCPRLAFL